MTDRINLAGLRRVLSEEDWGRRRAEHLRSIAESWDRLAALADDGTLTEQTLARVYDEEPDDGAHPLVIGLWARRLRSWVENPELLIVDQRAFAPYTCPCGEGRGWVTVTSDETGRTGIRPCDRCQPVLYARWRDHWRDPEHSCSECDGSRHRRRERTSSSTPDEGVEDRREAAHDRALDDLI